MDVQQTSTKTGTSLGVYLAWVHLEMSCPLAQLSAAGCKPSIKFSFLNSSTGTQNAKSKPQVYLETTNTTWSRMHSLSAEMESQCCRLNFRSPQGLAWLSQRTTGKMPIYSQRWLCKLGHCEMSLGVDKEMAKWPGLSSSGCRSRISSLTPWLIWLLTELWILLWVQKHHPIHTEPHKVPQNISLACSVQI